MRYWKPRKFERQPLVSMVVATYLEDPYRCQSLVALLAALHVQTYHNWEAIVVHDGPCPVTLDRERLDELGPGDGVQRVYFHETKERRRQFGHPHRYWAATTLAKGEIIGFTNDDNYYAPVYFEWLVSEMLRQEADFVHCDMVHSHQLWQFFPTKPRYKKLDLGGFLVRAELVRSTPWTDFSFRGDGSYINALVQKARKVVKVPACLFVHN